MPDYEEYTLPLAPGCVAHDDTAVGSGGGGGSGHGGDTGGGGGGGGGTIRADFPVTPGTTLTIRIGKPGDAGIYTDGGGTGGDTSINDTIYGAQITGVAGGGGGSGLFSGFGGSAGTTTNSGTAVPTVANNGQAGTHGEYSNPGLGGDGLPKPGGPGGNPGAPAAGSGGAAGVAGVGNGVAGTSPGGGGGGGGCQGTGDPAGGDGAAGSYGAVTIRFDSDAGHFEFSVSPNPSSPYYYPPGPIPMYGPNGPRVRGYVIG